MVKDLELQALTDQTRPKPEDVAHAILARGHALMLVASVAENREDLDVLMEALGFTISDWVRYKELQKFLLEIRRALIYGGKSDAATVD